MKYRINLLGQKKEQPLDRVIYFSLNYLRYILVITQIVVIFVFFYKFKVDQEIIDLKEAVDQKKEIIEISQPLLKEADLVSYKMKQVRPIVGKQEDLLNQMNYLVSIFPEKLFLRKLGIGKNTVTMDGYGEDAKLIKQLYQKMLKDKKFKVVNLNTLKKIDLGYQFVLTLEGYSS